MNAKRSMSIYAPVLLLVFSSSVALVYPNVPTMLQISVLKMGNDTLIVLSIDHSDPSSTHYVDAVDIEVNGELRDIVDLQPQVTTLFNYTYDWGVIDVVQSVRARAHCNLHGWSGWTSLETEPPQPSASPNATINLFIQIAMALILIIGVVFIKRGNLKLHKYTMTLAVAINAIMMITVMGPSMMNIVGVLTRLPQTLNLTLMAHGVLGGIAEVLGAILVFKKFGNVRMWMRIVLLLWTASLVLGMLIYLLFYGLIL